MSQGYVYILSNPAMPGLVKIGKTTRSAQARANELYQTGVPAPFKVECEVKTPDCDELEVIVHGAFLDKRYANDREFFEVELELVSDVLGACLEDQVRERVAAYLPNHEIVDQDLSFLQPDISRLAEQTGKSISEVIDALGYLQPSDVAPAFERMMETRKKWAEK